MSASAQRIDANIAEAQQRAGADGWISPRHRRAQAQRHQDDLHRARHPDHGFGPHGPGRRHARDLVPARAARRQCGGDRRLPDEEAGRLPHGVGAGLPQRSDRAGQRHHQLLPDDPDQRLVRARDRRSAAGRLRGDGPARHRQAPVQGGLPRAACRRTSASAWRARSARPLSGRPGGVYLDLPAKLFPQVMDAEAGTKSLVKVIDPAPAQIPGPERRPARARRAEERQAPADHPRQGRGLCAGR